MIKFSSMIIVFFVLSAFFAFTSSISDDSAFAEQIKKKKSVYIQNNDESQIQVNKYANYVHFQPEWNSYPSNLLFDVTNTWNRTSTLVSDSENTTVPKAGALTHVNLLHYLENKPYLEVQYDYLGCNYQWIHYAKYSADILSSKLDFAAGKQLDSDHSSALFSLVPSNVNYDKTNPVSVYSQFIPLCTSQNSTSFEFGVRIDDKEKGFDVYFVDSKDQRDNYHSDSKEFVYYPGCAGINYQSFSGTCHGVDKVSGLLVVIPDNLDKPLTKVYVKLKEISSFSKQL